MPIIETARGHIHYKDYRRADTTIPLVLLHGAGGVYLDWSIQLRRDCAAIAPDLVGHGRSAGTGRETVAEYALDVVALLDALQIEKAVIAGHSMGGAIAQTIALNFPERVYALLLCGTGAALPVNEAIINGIVEKPLETAQMLMKWFWSKSAYEQYYPQSLKRLLEIPPQITQADYRACNQFDVRNRLGEIQAPTLILAGTADKMTPLAWNQALADGIPNARLLTFEGGGHMFVIEAAEAVAQAVKAWLESLGM